MNIFYDDLQGKRLDADEVYFINRGVVLHDKEPMKRPDMGAVSSNPYRYLDDYKNMGFKFIDLPEEELVITIGHEDFRCFGKCNAGYFVLNEAGAVYLLFNAAESRNTEELAGWFPPHPESSSPAIVRYLDLVQQGIGLLFVNQNLQDFIACYSFLMMWIFSLKAQSDQSAEELSAQSVSLGREIADRSTIAMERGSYWRHMTFQMSENLGWFQLTPGLLPYLKYL